MIGQLRGTLLEKRPPVLLLDVSGVGYEVEAPMTVFYDLPDAGAELTLHTHFVVREDAQLLFGFCDKNERDLYRTYIRINGVGPKMGLALISSIDPSTLSRAVQNNEVGVLTKVPGVGKKTAERLMVELKSRIDTLIPQLPAAEHLPMPSFGSRAVYQEAEDALLALGYKSHQAQQAVMQARKDLEQKAAQSSGDEKDPTTEQIVTWVLRQFARSGA